MRSRGERASLKRRADRITLTVCVEYSNWSDLSLSSCALGWRHGASVANRLYSITELQCSSLCQCYHTVQHHWTPSLRRIKRLQHWASATARPAHRIELRTRFHPGDAHFQTDDHNSMIIKTIVPIHLAASSFGLWALLISCFPFKTHS